MISDWILIKFKQSHLFHFFGNRIYCLEKQETGEKYDFSHRIQSLVKIDTFGSDELKRKKTRNYVKRRARGRTYQRKKFVKITDEWSHGQKSQRDSEKNKKGGWFGVNRSFKGLITPDADKLIQWLFGKYHQSFSQSEESTRLVTEPVSHDGVTDRGMICHLVQL